MVDLKQNNIFFDPIGKIEQVLRENVVDVNKLRAASSNQRDKQWIFATLPEADDENYPRVSIIADTVRFETYGAGNQVEDVDNGELGNLRQVLRTNYGKIATVPFTIAVFVKKKQKHEVELYDGSVHTFQNAKLSDHVGNNIAKTLQIYRRKFIEVGMDIKVLGIGSTYENNNFLKAKNIEVEVELMDVWTQDYREAELISMINITEIQIPT